MPWVSNFVWKQHYCAYSFYQLTNKTEEELWKCFSFSLSRFLFWVSSLRISELTEHSFKPENHFYCFVRDKKKSTFATIRFKHIQPEIQSFLHWGDSGHHTIRACDAQTFRKRLYVVAFQSSASFKDWFFFLKVGLLERLYFYWQKAGATYPRDHSTQETELWMNDTSAPSLIKSGIGGKKHLLSKRDHSRERQVENERKRAKEGGRERERKRERYRERETVGYGTFMIFHFVQLLFDLLPYKRICIVTGLSGLPWPRPSALSLQQVNWCSGVVGSSWLAGG